MSNVHIGRSLIFTIIIGVISTLSYWIGYTKGLDYNRLKEMSNNMNDMVITATLARRNNIELISIRYERELGAMPIYYSYYWSKYHIIYDYLPPRINTAAHIRLKISQLIQYYTDNKLVISDIQQQSISKLISDIDASCHQSLCHRSDKKGPPAVGSKGATRD